MPEPQVIEPELSPPLEPPVGTPPEVPKDLDGLDLRFSQAANVPDWAKGKNSMELVDLVEQLRVSQPAPDPTPAPMPSVVPTPSPSPAIATDNIYSDTEGFVKSIQEYTQDTVNRGIAQASTPLLAPMASMARSASMNEAKNKDVWDAYGPEIDATMNVLPIQNRADTTVWNQAVDIVAGRHREELARKLADKMLANSGDSGMLPTNGSLPTGGAPSTKSPINALFADDDPSIKKFKDEGMGAENVIAHAARMGHSEEDYAKMLTTNVSRRYTTRGAKV